MTIRVTLGEPLWREHGDREVLVEYQGKEPPFLGGLALMLGLQGWTTEELLAVVNDRIIPPGEVGTLRLHDGDHVVLQLMLAGG